MEISVPDGLYHICAKTEFFHPPTRSRKPPVIARFQAGCALIKKAVSQRFPESTEKELENSEAVKILGKCDFSAPKRALSFLAVCKKYSNEFSNTWWYH
jgi:hypothetical protein